MINKHLAMYSESLGSVTDSDVNAASDDVLGVRNSHLLLVDDFDLLAWYAASSTLTRVRFGNASLSQRGQPHLFPTGRSDTIVSRPEVGDNRYYPKKLPRDEEITLLATTDAAGPVIANIALLLGVPDWSMNIPGGIERLMVRATATVVAGAASAWTALANLTFERDLLQGVYAVIGASVIAANAIAFRLRFPDEEAYNGKQLRPGFLVANALGQVPWEPQLGGVGEWGRFNTFSPPQVQVFDDTAGGTYEVRLDLVYLGLDRSLLRG